MTCEEFSSMLDNYASLTDEEKLDMNEHASVCEQCREELDFMLAVIAQLNTLPKIQPASDFAAELNKRLDLEMARISGFGRMFNSVRRNYRQYSTAAACLVLAVVIGANGKSLLDKLSPATDNIPPVTVSDNQPVASPSAAIDDAAVEVASIVETDKTVNDSALKVSSDSVNVASAFTTAPRTAVPTPSSSRGAISPIRNMSESINQIDLSGADKLSEPAYQGDDDMAGRARRIDDDNAGIAVTSLEDEEPVAENYTIARGVYRLPDAKIAEQESSITNANDVLEISEIGSRSDTTIARGRYYIPADEGYIAIDAENAIGVNSADAERAEELIRQYADSVDDSYYVINSENIPSMLEHMAGEGIDYQNKVGNSDNEKVSFKLVIE